MKLKFGHLGDQPALSPQFMMQCNYMNEGCDGGWSIFHGFFAENAGLVTEKCAPYTARTKGHKCSDYKDCKPYARVTKSYYVNGYNFSPTEMQIRKEMLMYGPVTTEFKCNDDFQVYKSGIMVQKAPVPEKMPVGQINAQKASEHEAKNEVAKVAPPQPPQPSPVAAGATADHQQQTLAQDDITVPNVDDKEYV